MDTENIIGIIAFFSLTISMIGINIKIYQLFSTQIKEIEKIKLLTINNAKNLLDFKQEVREKNKDNKSDAKDDLDSLKQEVTDLKTKQSTDVKELYSSVKKDFENLNEKILEKYLEVIMKNYNK